MSYIFCVLLMLALGHLSNGLPQAKPVQHDHMDLLQLTSDSRIVGGDDAPEGYAPHQVTLLYGVSFTVMLCGASIVSSTCVLTAAHCIDAVITWQGELSSSLYGVAGSNRWDEATTRIRFAKHVNHPEWDIRVIKNDIGVLITVEKIPMSDGVSPVPLKWDPVEGGVEVFVTGFGRLGLNGHLPEKLQLLYMATLSHEECEYELEWVRRVWGPTVPLDVKVEICTFHSCGRGMCHGDSGSALVTKWSRQQVGIVSWGMPCALGAPDVHVRISGEGIAPFLKKVLAEHCSSC